MTSRRYEQGLDVYASQFQIPREEVPTWFAERVGERFGEEAILSAAGAWADDELSLRDRSLVVISALITQGSSEQQLRVHTRWAIQHGWSRGQLEALATLLGVYAGYPRAGNGLVVMREELARLESGNNEPAGETLSLAAASPDPDLTGPQQTKESIDV